MKKLGWIFVIIVIISLTLLIVLTLNNSGENVEPAATQDSCDVNEDCVPEGVCHPTNCVNIENLIIDSDVICTMSCEPGTLDCGQGSCECVNNRCLAVINE